MTSRQKLDNRLNDLLGKFSEPSIAGYTTIHDGTCFPVFFINLKDGTLTERSSRKNQFDYAKKILLFASMNYDFCALPAPCAHGIFVFADNTGHARMSLIEGIGKTNSQKRYRRYTFYIDPEATNRTFIDRMCMDWFSFDKIKEAFSVERLSDEFFDEYKKIYQRFVEYATGKRTIKQGGKWIEIVTHPAKSEIMEQFTGWGDEEKAFRDYVKKMMGRLVFLQFLAKKGWLGVPAGQDWGNGDKEYMKKLFESKSLAVQGNYLDMVLEPLFFDSLNTDRSKSGDIAADELSLESGKKIRIPYLNGGLFERDVLDDTKVKFPASYFSDLFDTFERFNFTIDENDPNDAEIGVDPEMLGRIFENLLEDNKDKGAFYTPKEIVSYMCQESLIQYLGESPEIRTLVSDLDDSMIQDEQQKNELIVKLKSVKICDPAIGSGAFPMGMLNLLYRLLIKLGNIEDSSEDILRAKKEIIQNNIYGVDIEPGAVDIARLRFWLSIVVDEDIPTPLPNFDYKIMQGNSLLESFMGVDLSNLNPGEELFEKRRNGKKSLVKQKVAIPQQKIFDLFEEGTTIQDIFDDMSVFFNESDHKKRDKIRKRIHKNVITFICKSVDNDKSFSEKERLRIKNNAQNLELKNTPFFLWHLYFGDVFANGGFDIVIGNPPYIKEYTNASAFDGFRESAYYQGKMDLWYAFACICLDLLNESGSLCFIATNNWVTSDAASILRNKITSDCIIRKMIDFNSYMIFEDSASIQTMIMLFAKNTDLKSYSFDYRKLTKSKATSQDAFDILNKDLKDATYLTPTVNRKKMLNTFFVFTEDKNTGILNKIVSKKNFDITNAEISQGIIGGPDDAFKVRASETANWKENEKSLLHKFYTSTEKWTTQLSHSDKDIIYVTKETVCDANEYPNVIKHLSGWRDELDNRREVINGARRWFDLWWPRVETLFKVGPKIIFAARTFSSNFMYTDQEFYASRNNFIVKSNRINLKYLVGFLNSKLILFFMMNTLKHTGELLQIDKNQFAKIPIFVPSEDEQQKVSEIVSEIINKKSKTPNAIVEIEEQKINTLIYQFYKLTQEEIDIIEQATCEPAKKVDATIILAEESKSSCQKSVGDQNDDARE